MAEPSYEQGGGQNSFWAPFDLDEETEKVGRHLSALKDILCQDPPDLDISGGETHIITEIFFDRFIFSEDGEQVALSPYIFTGILTGVDNIEGQPCVVLENCRTELLGDMPDDGWRYEYEILISVEEKAIVPVREINSFGATSGTPSGWEALRERNAQKDEDRYGSE